EVGTFLPALLLMPDLFYIYHHVLVETDEANPVSRGTLRNWAGYAKANWQALDAVSLDFGVRYEHAEQGVEPVQVFNEVTSGAAATSLERGYWLPAATVTWEVQPDLQLRLS